MTDIKPPNFFRMFLLGFFVFGIPFAKAEIVFDGLNSYSSYIGKASQLRYVNKGPVNSTVYLKRLSPSQIDYTMWGTNQNRTDLNSARGMVIEAEGFRSFTRQVDQDEGKGFIVNLMTKNRGILHTLGLARRAKIMFEVKVATSGIYTFVVDGAYDAEGEKAVLKISTSVDGGATTRSSGSWSVERSTGSWQTIQESLGDPIQKRQVDLELTPDINTLVFEFMTERSINTDCFRVINFLPTTIGNKKSTKQVASTIDQMVIGESKQIPLPIMLLVIIGAPTFVLVVFYLIYSRSQ